MEAVRIGTLLQDLRYGARQLARNRVFSAVAIITLALGIGANTAIFSVVDGILFRPLPFPESHELVNVWTDVSERGVPRDEWLSWANFNDLRTESRTIEALSEWGGWRPTLRTDGANEQVTAAVVGARMFDRVLQIAPALGRTFGDEDALPGAAPVVILSHGLWQRAFGGAGDVVGQSIVIDGASTEILGVMPSGFRPPFVPDAELWRVYRVDPVAQLGARGGFSWRAVGRLADPATVESANSEFRTLGSRLEALYPESNTDMSFKVAGVRDDLVGPARSGLLVLLGAVGFVLLVACVNITNLLLGRAAARREELAVRSALGAGRGRIVTQLLTESGLLALVGGAVGVVVAFWGTRLLVALAPPGTPRIEEVGVDGRVLAVTALITLLAGAFFGLVPALRATREAAFGELRGGGRGRTGSRSAFTRSALVVAQVALALVLLVGAGLMARSFENLRTHDLGFRPANVLTMQVNLFGPEYADGDVRRNLYDELESRLAAIPGVEQVALTETVPLTGFDGDVSFNIEGRPIPEPGSVEGVWLRRTTPTYLETMGIALRAGRAFTPADDQNAGRVVIINETFANEYFPAENPVGRRINLGNPGDPTWREIVGVAGDVKNFGIREDSRPALYLPYAQATAPYLFPVLRTSVPPESVIPAVREVLAEIDESLAAGRITTMNQLVDEAIASDRFVAVLLALFAAVALVLAVIGLYGVVTYNVGRRLPEMGIRMAMGAAARDIIRMVVGQSMTLVIGGVVLGLLMAAALSRLVEGLLFGVGAFDPLTFLGTAAILVVAGGLAAALPAVRAGRVDPVRVLNAE